MNIDTTELRKTYKSYSGKSFAANAVLNCCDRIDQLEKENESFRKIIKEYDRDDYRLDELLHDTEVEKQTLLQELKKLKEIENNKREATHIISAVYWPQREEVEATWEDIETSKVATAFFKVDSNTGEDIAETVMPCVYQNAVVKDSLDDISFPEEEWDHRIGEHIKTGKKLVYLDDVRRLVKESLQENPMPDYDQWKQDYNLMNHYRKTLEKIASNYDIDVMAEAKDALSEFLNVGDENP
jgi:predicted RNase H-like nuclease (RuvC/YqgF family)